MSPKATAVIKTPLPTGVEDEDIIASLHDHALMINMLCPQLIECVMTAGEKDRTATYAVTDKKPFGKVSNQAVFFNRISQSFGRNLTGNQTTYHLTLTNNKEGVDSLVVAKPTMTTLTIAGKWRVEGSHLIEDVEINSNLVFRNMAKTNVEKTHPDQHKMLLEQVRRSN